jgi:putative transposase
MGTAASPPSCAHRGMLVNRKRVARLMREDNLIAFGQRKYGVATTDSQHDFEVYLNWASRMKVTAVNQLGVADITYIRLQREFVFLAVILDAYSRRVVGRGLARSLHRERAQRALKEAMELRRPQPGLVHHSDRAIQYACREYTALQEAHGLIPSLSRPGNPYDNARKLHEDSETRGGLLPSLPGLRRLEPASGGVYRPVLQPPAAAFGSELSGASGL